MWLSFVVSLRLVRILTYGYSHLINHNCVYVCMYYEIINVRRCMNDKFAFLVAVLSRVVINNLNVT